VWLPVLAGLLLLAVIASAAVLTLGGDPAVPVPIGGAEVADLEPVHLPERVTIGPDVRGLAADRPAEVTLPAGTAVAYRFDVPDHGRAGLWLEGLSGSIDPLLLLFDAFGTEVAMDDDSAGGRDGHDAALVVEVNPADGPFTAVVSSLDASQSGDVRLHLDLPEVRDLADGATGEFTGLPGAVQAVLFPFTPVEGETLTVTLRSADADMYLQLFDTAGNLLVEDDDSGGGAADLDARIVWTAPAGGDHVLVGQVFDPTARATWTLEVDRTTG
jgi:hypothetical protein